MKNNSNPREFTLLAFILGSVLSVVLTASNTYLGLKAGLTISASIPAAVMSMLILICIKPILWVAMISQLHKHI